MPVANPFGNDSSSPKTESQAETARISGGIKESDNHEYRDGKPFRIIKDLRKKE